MTRHEVLLICSSYWRAECLSPVKPASSAFPGPSALIWHSCRRLVKLH